ncbi:sialidase family protein [Ideonella sp. DXS29W]|uniref:Sialidase family protein n=1 Tax=Ideonella lacteola TaxID=2984193 RepID=A0ABU9BVS2_9BURK
MHATTRVVLSSMLTVLSATCVQAAGSKVISGDPYANPDAQHATQVEPDTFAFGSTVVAVFQTGRFFDGGSTNIGFSTSQDKGKTWKRGFLPAITVNSTPAGSYDRVSDPTVSYDAKHKVWMVSSLAIKDGSGKAVLTSRSTDGGLTWSDPVTVSTTNGFYDKNWIVCDNVESSPHYGNCYTTWDDVTGNDLLLSSTSSDGGKTWGSKKTTADNAHGLGGQPVTQPNGNVVVPLLGLSGQILSYRSTNGGATWESTVVVANINDHEVAGELRTETLPSAEVDGAGKVYVVWQDCRFRSGCASNDIVMSTSTDGTSWTKPVRIPIDPTSSTVDHFIPGIAVDKGSSGNTARLGLTYYFYPNANCTIATCQLSVGFVSSVDGGQTWTAPVTLAGPMKLTDIADTSQGSMVGDYISTSFAGAKAVSVYGVGKAKSGSKFDQAMYASRTKVSAQQKHPARVVDDPVLSSPGPAMPRRGTLPVFQ